MVMPRLLPKLYAAHCCEEIAVQGRQGICEWKGEQPFYCSQFLFSKANSDGALTLRPLGRGTYWRFVRATEAYIRSKNPIIPNDARFHGSPFVEHHLVLEPRSVRRTPSCFGPAHLQWLQRILRVYTKGVDCWDAGWCCGVLVASMNKEEENKALPYTK